MLDDGTLLVPLNHTIPLRNAWTSLSYPYHMDEADILEAACALQGLERLDQIKYAIVERNGDIMIVPAQGSKA